MNVSKVSNVSVKDTTKEVGAIGITGAGLVIVLKSPFTSLTNWMKEAARDENGNIIKENIDGKEVIKKLEKYDKTKVAVVIAAAALVIGGFAFSKISKKVKARKAENEVKKAEEAEKAREAAEKAKAEEAEKARAEAEKAKAEAEKARAEAEKAKAEAEKADKVDKADKAEEAKPAEDGEEE